tara:strand:- start:5172 stop:5315 length:144 start_codon:yes stop_codon:yes gene_type:complete
MRLSEQPRLTEQWLAGWIVPIKLIADKDLARFKRNEAGDVLNAARRS